MQKEVKNTTITCCKKGCSETNVELHHIIPKYCGGTDLDGRRYLCKKHHDILHNIIPSIIFRNLPIDKKERLREDIKRFSERWVEQ